MTTTSLPAASPPRAAAVLDLDARLALTAAEMGGRLDEAAVAFEVNTAHIAAAPPVEITAPVPLTPTSARSPYSTPIAATLHRASLRLETGGWCAGTLRDEQRARCLIGAIRAEAATRSAADDACVLLLEVIRRDFPTVETIPSWNDAQRDRRIPARYLDRAATVAHARLI